MAIPPRSPACQPEISIQEVSAREGVYLEGRESLTLV